MQINAGEYFKPKMISTEHGFTDAANTEVRVFVRRYMFLNSVLLGTLQLIVISSRYERHSEEKGEVLYRQKVLQQGVHRKCNGDGGAPLLQPVIISMNSARN